MSEQIEVSKGYSAENGGCNACHGSWSAVYIILIGGREIRVCPDCRNILINKLANANGTKIRKPVRP